MTENPHFTICAPGIALDIMVASEHDVAILLATLECVSRRAELVLVAHSVGKFLQGKA